MAKTSTYSAKFRKLEKQLEGDFRYDRLSTLLYATDASAYREIPLAVAVPKSIGDVKKLLAFAVQNKCSLIPRGAGTSLAGQVVGPGIVVDVSKHLTRIIEINPDEQWVRVEPGVVLSELNHELKKYGFAFGPETSTANRCTMGGMLGNNSCGLHSLVHGSVREHVLEVKTILSDNSEVLFGKVSNEEFRQKCALDGVEGDIYRYFNEVLSNNEMLAEIVQQYPHPSVPRRNNGYALDALAQMQPFNPNGEPFNVSKLLAGSEGTLAFVSEMKLNIIELPPQHKALLCVHFKKLSHAFNANVIALKYNPSAIELMDKNILDLTKENITQRRNRFFVKGEPEAILIIELWGESVNEIENRAAEIEKAMRHTDYGYYFPLVWGADIPKVWALRTAGLGVLSNMPGDAKPVSVVEDTAIPVNDLPDFLSEFQSLLDVHKLKAVYHAHIATGELHLRPVLNLKSENDVKLFRIMARETACLVKKYRGSLSGEHGDGRLRGEFIPYMLGDKVYAVLKELKSTWDPNNIFNPGKIVDTPPMNKSLRYEPGMKTPELNSYFDYKLTLGMARAIEKCNGSADCRKSQISGGTMCPSFMATRDELHSTRGRANILRELLTRQAGIAWDDSHMVLDALELCLSCKACKSECPSGVDIAKLKADFLQNHYDANPIPIEVRLVANYPRLMQVAIYFNPLSKWLFKASLSSYILKKIAGFAVQRPLPVLPIRTLNNWYKKRKSQAESRKKVYLFNDEFLNTSDAEVGIKAILLLEKLGYEVIIPKHKSSGRTYISKGLLKKARKLANFNVEVLSEKINSENPLVGIEPSAILTFRDEYPELVRSELADKAKTLAANTLMLDEFFMREVEKGNIKAESFTIEKSTIKLHGHCHQKALATTKSTLDMLGFPKNFNVEEIPSGCCGMAGSFGYEKQHYGLSMQIGEMVLFPAVRASNTETIISAPGTSCREQIEHGTGRKALHPVEVIYAALR